MPMNLINMHEAKTHLSRLVASIERGEEAEVVIARNGRAVARLVPIAAGATGKRVGLLKGKFQAPSLEQLDAGNAEIESMFRGGH